jgi:hypothetical protein
MGDSDLVPVTAKVDPDTKDRLDEMADDLGESRSAALRKIVRDHFEPDRESVLVPLVFGITFLAATVTLSGDTHDTVIYVIGGLFIVLQLVRGTFALLRAG